MEPAARGEHASTVQLLLSHAVVMAIIDSQTPPGPEGHDTANRPPLRLACRHRRFAMLTRARSLTVDRLLVGERGRGAGWRTDMSRPESMVRNGRPALPAFG